MAFLIILSPSLKGIFMVTFSSFRMLNPESADLARELINADAHERSAFSSFMTLWMGFNGWMECVTDARTDAQMITAFADHIRLIDAYDELMEQDADFRSDISTLASMWPVLNVRDVNRKLGRDALRKYGDHELWAAVGREAVKHEPQGWVAGSIPTWPQLLRTIYCIRCNLFHGAKSPQGLRDHHLVVGCDKVLRTFIESTNCLEWYD
jgi:hypothetical protein